MGVIIKNGNGKVIEFGSIKGGIIINGSILRVDGESFDLDSVEGKVIHIHVNGPVEILDVDTCSIVEIHGNVGSVKTVNGDVTVHEKVTGNVSTTNGDVLCPEIHGNVSTVNGDIG